MKTFVILFTLFYFINALAVAPYGIKGQQDSGTLYSNVHQFPNNQVTNLGGINALVETGNKNLLINPSFEHSTFSYGWFPNLGTATASSVNSLSSFDGKSAVIYTPIAQTIQLRQQSSINSTQLVGSQGLASIRVKSSVALKVCSFIDSLGATATNCVNVIANNQWGLYKVPFLLGSVSSGISVESVGNVTGTVYIDDAFVGVTSLTQEMNACNSVNCETEFSAKISAAGVISGENLDWLSSCSAGSGIQTCTFNTSIFTVAPNCTAISLISTNTATTMQNSAPTNTGFSFLTRETNTGTALARDIHVICQKQGADFTTSKQLSNGNTYSSTNADTDWASCGLTGSAFTGFGSSVPTPELQCKRQGADLLIKGKFTAGTTPTAVEARMALPTWNGVQLISAGSSISPSIQAVGVGGRSDAAAGHGILVEPSVSYLTFSQYADGVRFFLTKQNGNIIASSGTIHTFNARIPIEGWQQSNIIIGQFNGLESCTDTLNCTDTFSAQISTTGVVSNESVDFISGNCTHPSTGSNSCTFKTGVFTVAPNCVGTAVDRNNIVGTSASSTVVSANTANRTGGAIDDIITLVCQKQGADYVGKTAKAVASDQSLRIPGTTNYVTYMASLQCSATSSILHQDGSWVSSIGNIATGTCAVTIASNKFSNANYRCSSTFTSSQNNTYPTGGQIATTIIRSKTLTGLNLQTYYNSGGSTVANTEFTVDLICTGQAP
jgi:hypothetical protein